jgi:hypothetical protein
MDVVYDKILFYIILYYNIIISNCFNFLMVPLFLSLVMLHPFIFKDRNELQNALTKGST